MSARGRYNEDLNQDIRDLLAANMPTAQIARLCHCEIMTVERLRMADCPTEIGAKRFADELLFDSPGQWRLPRATPAQQLEAIAACWDDCLGAGPPAIKRAIDAIDELLARRALAPVQQQELGSLRRAWDSRAVTRVEVGYRLDALVKQLEALAADVRRKKSA